MTEETESLNILIFNSLKIMTDLTAAAIVFRVYHSILHAVIFISQALTL